MKKIMLLLLLLMIPVASAFQITSFNLTNIAGNQITSIGAEIQNGAVLARPNVQYEGEFTRNIIANLSTLDRFLRYTQLTLTCTQLENGGICTSSNPIVIFTNTSTHQLTFFQEQLTSTYTYNLNLKTTKPEIRQIKITGCESEQCFIRSNQLYEVQIEFNQQENFSESGIFFEIGTGQSVMSECQGNTCKGVIATTCTDGVINLNIDSRSKNNEFQLITGTLTKSLTCDNTRPIIQNIQILQETLENQLTIPIKINVSEELSPSLELEFKINQIGYNQTINCQNKQQTLFICEGNLNLRSNDSTPIRPGVYNIQINARDLAGNTDTKNQTIRILAQDQTTTTNWRVARTEMAHSSMNSQTLVFDRDSYARFELTEQNTNVLLRDIEIRPNDCVPRTLNTTGYVGDIQNLNLVNLDNKSFTLKYTVKSGGAQNRYNNINSLVFDCPITLRSRTTSSIIQNPQTINVTLTIALTNQKRLDQRLTQDKLQEEFEELNRLLSQINSARNIVTGIQLICGASTSAHGAFAAIGVILESLETITGWNPASRVATTATQEGTARGYKKLMENFQKNMKLCKFFTCDQSFIVPNFWSNTGIVDNPVVSNIGAVAGINASSYATDPYKSLSAAINNMCVPGIIHIWEKSLQIHCEYYECMLEGVAMLGLDPEFCEESRSIAQCVMFAERITSLIAPAEIMKRAAASVQSWLQDPLSFMSGTAYYLACSPLLNQIGLGSFHGSGACTKIEAALNAATAIETVSSIARAMLDPVPNSCDRTTAVITAYMDYFENPTINNYRGLPGNPAPEQNPNLVITQRNLFQGQEILLCQENNCAVFTSEVISSRQHINSETGKIDWGKKIDEGQFKDLSVTPRNDEGERVRGLGEGSIYQDIINEAAKAHAEKIKDVTTPAGSESAATAVAQASAQRVELEETANEANRALREAQRKFDDNQRLTQELANKQSEIQVARNQKTELETQILAEAASSQMNDLSQATTINHIRDPNHPLIQRRTAIESQIDRLNREISATQTQITNLGDIPSEQDLENLRREREQAIVKLTEAPVPDVQIDKSFFNHMRYVNTGMRGFNSIYRMFGIDGSGFDRRWKNYYFDINFGFMGWMNNWMTQASQALSTVSQFERNICINSISRDGTSFMQEDYPVIRTSGAGFRPGLYLIAREVVTELPNQNTEYTYIVGGFANPKLETEFEVYLTSNTNTLDITSNISNNNRMNANMNNPIGNQVGNQGRVTTSLRYDVVCIRFENRLYDLFDITGTWGSQLTQGRTSEYCRAFERG